MKLVIMATIVVSASLLTYLLRHRFHWNIIRASTVPTIVFASIVQLIHFDPTYSALFFGATFVGMTNSDRMGMIEIFVTSLVYFFAFTILLKFLDGPGGILGTLAFLSTSSVFILKKFYLGLSRKYL